MSRVAERQPDFLSEKIKNNRKNVKKALDKSLKNGIMKTLASESHIILQKSRKKSKIILKKGLTKGK